MAAGVMLIKALVSRKRGMWNADCGMEQIECSRTLALYAPAMKTVRQLDRQSAIRIPRFHEVTIICETVH